VRKSVNGEDRERDRANRKVEEEVYEWRKRRIEQTEVGRKSE